MGAHACISTRCRLLVLHRHGLHRVAHGEFCTAKTLYIAQTAPSHASFSTVILTRGRWLPLGVIHARSHTALDDNRT